MRVGLVTFDDKDIDAIELGVSGCGAKGEMRKPDPLFLNGPFRKGEIYAAFPSWPMDYSDYAVGDAVMAHDTEISGHLIIRSLTLFYADGSKRSFDKDMTAFLAKNVSNFCSNAPGTDSLPPSATIEQH